MKDVFSRAFDSFWFVVLLAVVFFEPQYIQDCLPAVDNMFFICKVVVLAFLVLLGLIQYRFSPLFVLVAVFEIYLIGNTYIQDGSTFSMVKIAIDVLALFLIVEFGLKSNAYNTLNAISWVFFVLIGISMVTSIIYPDGMYIASYTNRVDELNATRFFLGHKNQALVLTMAGVACCYMRDIHKKGVPGKFSIVATGMIFINVVAQDSLTSILVVACLILLVCIICFKRIGGINPYFLIGLAVTADILIVGFQVQDYFANFFDLFGKDVSFTNRTAIWSIAEKVLSESPLYGFGLEHSSMTALRFGGYGSPHNFYFAQMYYGGVIALVFIAMIFFSALRRLRKCPCVASSLLACILMLMLFQGIVESFSVGIIRFVLVLALAYNVGLIDERVDERRCREKRRGLRRVSR